MSWIKNYLIENVALWFTTLFIFFKINESWKNFVDRFYLRWNQINWKKKVFETFSNIKQKNNEIEVYIADFISLYEMINDVIIDIVVVRDFINECKNTIKMQLKSEYQKSLNMVLDEWFNLVSKLKRTVQKKYTKFKKENTKSFLHAMNVKKFVTCYNCDQSNHRSPKCKNFYVFDHVSSDWKKSKGGRKDQKNKKKRTFDSKNGESTAN